MSPIEAEVVKALRTVFDPEIPVNVYDLGLIYALKVDKNGFADVKMTLTAPNCPVAGILPGQVQEKVQSVAGITGAKLELVFDPPWDKSMMSDAARLELGFDLGFDVVNVANIK